MSSTTKINWDGARKEYLSDTTISLQDIADKYGVSKVAAGLRAKKENWTGLRQELADLAFSEFQKRLVDEKAKSQERHLLTYKNIQALVNGRISEIYQASEKDKTKFDIKEVEALARTAKISIDGERVVLGLPNGVQGHTDAEGKDVWGGFAEAIVEYKRRQKESDRASDKQEKGNSNS